MELVLLLFALGLLALEEFRKWLAKRFLRDGR
jgi:hypothetical protein